MRRKVLQQKSLKPSQKFSGKLFISENTFTLYLDLHAPLKKIFKQKLKVRSNPWITLGLQKRSTIKNHLLTEYIKLKDVEAELQYKHYINLLSTPRKESIRSYLTNYFQNNLNDFKITGKCIKILIYLKKFTNVVLFNIFDNG